MSPVYLTILIGVFCLASVVAHPQEIFFEGPKPAAAKKPDQLAFSEQPECVGEFGLCTNDSVVNNYPTDFILNALVRGAISEAAKEVLRGDNTNIIEVDFGGISQRFGGTSVDDKQLLDETTACKATETIIHPTMGKNMNNDWLFIINTENFPQGVRVETCVGKNKPCVFNLEGTVCRQKHIYRKLLAVNGDGIIDADNFRIPSCCVCYIKNEFLGVRFGASQGPNPDGTTSPEPADV